MRIVAWIVFITLGASSPALAKRKPIDPLIAIEHTNQTLFAQHAPSVVFISSGKGFGSGFFIAKDGLILTNDHVVEGVDKVDVVLNDGRRFMGRVVERAADDVDLALVRIASTDTPALELGGLDELRVGSWVASIGHGSGAIWTFNTGMVSNIYPDGNERPVFQTQIPLNPGNSGGPILDRRGRVVGIVTAGIVESNSINFCIKSDMAMRVLQALGGTHQTIKISAPTGVPIFVNGKMAGTGPHLVVDAKEGSYEVFAVIQGQMVKRRFEYPKVSTVDLVTDEERRLKKELEAFRNRKNKQKDGSHEAPIQKLNLAL